MNLASKVIFRITQPVPAHVVRFRWQHLFGRGAWRLGSAWVDLSHLTVAPLHSAPARGSISRLRSRSTSTSKFKFRRRSSSYTSIMESELKRVCLIGSGNWGSAIAKIVGLNVLERPDLFHPEVMMYVYEEILNGVKLTEIINVEHENVKYLPDIKIPANVIAVPDVVKASANADILIFVLPHQFVLDTCQKMKSSIKRNALGISLIKGFILTEGEGIQLVSKIISKTLEIESAVLMGANLATEVASEMFCETTIACENESHGPILKALFETSYFRCKVIQNVPGVEACGALKNVVGIGAGIVDGLGYGDNTKAAVIRLGLMEMIKFTKFFLKNDDRSVFFESCGIADLVATCHGGRNRLLGEAVVKSMKKRGMAGVDIRLLEKEILRGQSFQGPLIAKEIYAYLSAKNLLDSFPLLVAIHRICTREIDPRNFIDCLREHPEHM